MSGEFQSGTVFPMRNLGDVRGFGGNKNEQRNLWKWLGMQIEAGSAQVVKVVQMKRAVGTLRMTKCTGWQARGKGLARRTAQIVPTCL
jgi:hypothetical protein